MTNIRTVIMAGGNGSRLWPLSRSLYPKQFLKLNTERSMLQTTINRVKPLSDHPSLIVCNEEHRFITAEQARQETTDFEILLEPVGRNTAPAIALAAIHALTKQEDPLLLVLPADHLIKDEVGFRDVVASSLLLAEKGFLVTFGVVPTVPETGYGYICTGNKEDIGYLVKDFVEKPNESLAKEYIDSGNHYWNSGMFLFKASCYLSELKKYRPDIYMVCEKTMSKAEVDLDFIRISEHHFNNCPQESIDYAVMEKTDKAIMVPLTAGWSDIGSWSSLWEVSDKDSSGNVVSGDVIAQESSNCIIKSTNKLIATIGVSETVIIETSDAVLVADKKHVNKLKDVVKTIESLGRDEHKIHREVFRPWGKYETVDIGERYQVKRITVKPKHRLSVQKHYHRSEHWVVVSGSALVGKGDEEKLITENESIYIPLGCIHWLENPSIVPLELIEIQVGNYLGEDDIVRLSDNYGRV